MAALTVSAPPKTSTRIAEPVAAQGPTVWQACLSQLAQELADQGQDPAAFVFMVGRSHFNLFAVSEASSYCLSVFERTLLPLTLSAPQRAQMIQALSHQPYPFPWASAPAWTCAYCQHEQASEPGLEEGELWSRCPVCGGN